ncbi:MULTISPECIES: ImmA/IrrE family metallo-endopeptidase [Sphingomonas]|uniref:ImmA/IrrE family metallo-endopeptidase n=2 Tax=Sphingomonas TaxID=13687 RepID=A0ABU4PR15_9SPHN|nr:MULTISPECIES: ImmA/IrrE family metallo-endopeptidase [Sphingomonas]MDR6790243.1 hypothetical protein [Sphingomonas sp. BE138]MDX5986586.1 ImmA/IrrE family metallo-endopeptidase [Sphingomonas echinoides]
MKGLGQAEKLLQSLGVTSPDEIDIEAIAWTMGAKVRNGILESCEARIIGFRNQAIITVKGDGDPRRRRFSIAHELGHWQHHRGRSSVCRASEIGSVSQGGAGIERQADNYAADLLMPAYLFRPLAAAHRRPSFEAIDALAAAFSTSRLATAQRFIDHSPWPCMIVCHGQNGRRWFRRNGGIPDHWFPRDDLDPESDAMDVLYGKIDRSRPTIIGADAWFDRRGADRFELTEECVKGFGNDVLALLTLKDQMLD